MARQLWLLRHADAEPHGAREDSQRRLTARGERQARLAGVALGRAQVHLDALLVSPKVRAQQTAQLAAEGWGEGHGDVPSGAHPEGHTLEGTGRQAGEHEHQHAHEQQQAHEQQATLRTHPPLAGGFDAAQALDALAAIPADGRLMLVGHEPDLSNVVAELTGARVDLKKGGLAVVRLGLNGAGGELIILLRPRELALIADLISADV
jgi:phosphohistidine phosphatase